MGHFEDDFRRPSPRTLYRDKSGGKLFGVFSGIADYFGFRKGPTQLVGFILCFSMPPLILAYIVLGFILPTRPDNLYASPSIERMWRSYRRSPIGTVDEVKHRYRNMEARMQKMERHVTSRKYNLDKDFQNL